MCPYSLCCLKPTTVEVVISEDLTIHQFEHTKLIGENITLSINTIAVDVCCRTIIAAEEETIIFDRLHQCPQTNQVRVTIKVLCSDVITRTNASVNLLFDLCRFLIRNKGDQSRHLAGKIYHFLYISEGFLIVQDVCIRLHELAVGSISDDEVHRIRYSITKIILCSVESVRSNNDLLGDYLTKLISDRVRSILITTTKTNKITLNDRFVTRQPIKTSVKNCCNFALIELIDLSMIVSNTNLFLVKNCLGSYKELTVGGINSPHDCGCPVNLNAQLTTSSEPIQDRKITRQDGIFGVFEVCVFHDLSMARKKGSRNPPCATYSTVTLSINS